jgi:hypothetical protein
MSPSLIPLVISFHLPTVFLHRAALTQVVLNFFIFLWCLLPHAGALASARGFAVRAELSKMFVDLWNSTKDKLLPQDPNAQATMLQDRFRALLQDPANAMRSSQQQMQQFLASLEEETEEKEQYM